MKRKLRLLGHICTIDDSRLLKHTLFVTMESKSKRERLRKEWLDDITEWCNLKPQDLFHLTQKEKR